MSNNDGLGIGADVTINGTIISVIPNLIDTSKPVYVVRLKDGTNIHISEEDINTYRPKMVTNDIDMRKGN